MIRLISSRDAISRPATRRAIRHATRHITRYDEWILNLSADTDTQPVFITVQEAAENLEMKNDSLRSWIRRGKFPATKIGNQWFINQEDVVDFLAGRDTRRDTSRDENVVIVNGDLSGEISAVDQFKDFYDVMIRPRDEKIDALQREIGGLIRDSEELAASRDEIKDLSRQLGKIEAEYNNTSRERDELLEELRDLKETEVTQPWWRFW